MGKTLPNAQSLRTLHHDGKAQEVLHGTIQGNWLKAAVYGANDGIVTTFAVVAGALGANLDNRVVVILGIANMVADGLSMALGDYLGSISENRYRRQQLKLEQYEYEQVPDLEQQEIIDMYVANGYSRKDAESLVKILAKNPKHMVELGFQQELGELPQTGRMWLTGVITFVAFVLAGSLPLIPYILSSIFGAQIPMSVRLQMSVAATGLALFAVGSLRTLITDESWVKNGLQVLGVGSIAATAAYVLGVLIERMVL